MSDYLDGLRADERRAFENGAAAVKGFYLSTGYRLANAYADEGNTVAAEEIRHRVTEMRYDM